MVLREDKREWLTAIFVSALVISNVLSAKLIAIGPIVFPGGVICYAITYLVSDIAGELYGKEQAKQMLWYGLVCQAMCSALISFTVILPSADVNGMTVNMVLGSNAWFVIASLVAYVISQAVDVSLFHYIRTKLTAKGKHWKWLWNNVSTIISQAIDTAVYLFIAFGIGMEYLWTGQSVALLSMMAGHFIVKVVLALADTPIFYLLTRRERKQW